MDTKPPAHVLRDSFAYKDKLVQFNSTPKYIQEMEFMTKFMGIKNHNVLDYGCGIGTMVKYLNSTSTAKVYGYDKYQYVEESKWFVNNIADHLHKVYFMHSLAHIENVQEKIIELKKFHPIASIYVLTPNRFWIEKMWNEDYIPDKTVIRHFSPRDIIQLFEDSGYEIDIIGQLGQEKDGCHERIFMKTL